MFNKKLIISNNYIRHLGVTLGDDRILPYLVAECVITLDLWYTQLTLIDVAEHAESLRTDPW